MKRKNKFNRKDCFCIRLWCFYNFSNLLYSAHLDVDGGMMFIWHLFSFYERRKQHLQKGVMNKIKRTQTIGGKRAALKIMKWTRQKGTEKYATAVQQQKKNKKKEQHLIQTTNSIKAHRGQICFLIKHVQQICCYSARQAGPLCLPYVCITFLLEILNINYTFLSNWVWKCIFLRCLCADHKKGCGSKFYNGCK